MEDVLAIYEKEETRGDHLSVGGQTPSYIAQQLAEAGSASSAPPRTIDLAEDRDRFRNLMDKLGIPMPPSGMASNLDQALAVAARNGYPFMVRPSYVLGGRGMEIVHDE